MDDLNQFKNIIWIIELLTTEVMIKKQNYWKEFFILIETNYLEPNDDMSLKLLMDLGIQQYRD